MNVSHPLKSIAPPLDALVLEVLAGTTRPLSGREITRIVGSGSANGVWNALRRLSGHGLVEADRRTKATFYVANRAHLAWPSIETIARLRTVLVDRMSEAIAAWQVAPIHASAFGSFARADGDERSDIDLLLVRDGDLDPAKLEVWETQSARLRDDVLAWTGNRCQILDVDLAGFRARVEAGDPIVGSWQRDEIVLAGVPVDVLASTLG
jgi:hypothetical protein